MKFSQSERSEVSKRGWRTEGVGARKSSQALFSTPVFLCLPYDLMRRRTQVWWTIFAVFCATPGAEPRHEIFFYFFRVLFMKGALPSRHHQNSLEGFAAFSQSTFC